MKSIFKFMTVALAAGLAVSCSDDLNLEQRGYVAQKGDLNGTLYTAEPTRVALLEDVGSSTTPVWSKKDKVNVFSAKRLNYNQYTLAAGEGTSQGIFSPTPGSTVDADLASLTDLYAITEADYQYGVSATKENNGKILLTAEIPQDFQWEKLAAEQNSYRLPSPYWGAASFGENEQLNVFFRPLTGILRLDLALLPKGVKGIVLVTGNNTEFNQHRVLINYQPATTTGEGPDAVTTPESGVYYGSSEGLSGHFNTVLDYRNQTEYEPLGNDRALVCYDTLRVDFPEATKANADMVVYIPLIAQHYDNLKVLAVTKDYLNPYTWDGEILREFDDLVVKNGAIINLSMTSEITLAGITSPLEASKEIANRYDGKHNLIVNLPDISFGGTAGGNLASDTVLYVINNPKDNVGRTDVTINMPKVTGNNIQIAEWEAVFTGDVPNTGAQFLRFKADGFHGTADFGTLFTTPAATAPTLAEELEPQAAERNVAINLGVDNEKPIYVTLPHANVLINTEEAQSKSVNVISANTKDVSGYDYDNTYNAVSLEQNAGLKFKGVYSVVNYYSGGAVYFFDEESEITQSLNIFGTMPKGLRITDALVNTITYPNIKNNDQGTTNKTWIYTTGSAAIKQLKDPTDKVKIKAYWSGKRLTRYALSQGYEGQGTHDDGNQGAQSNYNITSGAIYTAAQLQGMGLSQTVYDYTISPKVESIWLGGVTFPWIGAEVELLTTPPADDLTSLPMGTGQEMAYPFSLDGRNVTLKNMILDIYSRDLELPGCCGTTQRLRVERNLGLIRTIRTSYTSADESEEDLDEAVLIKNIQLDDVLLDSHGFAIDNVGSLVGIIESEGNVTIGGSETSKVGTTISNFTDIRIASKGNNIGGIVGELESKKAVNISKVNVESIENNNTYIHGGHIQGNNNVGGIVGRLTYWNAYDDPNNRPDAGTSTTDDTWFKYDFYLIQRGVDETGMVFQSKNAEGEDERTLNETASAKYAAAIATDATDEAKNAWNSWLNSLWYIDNREFVIENLATKDAQNHVIVAQPVGGRTYYTAASADNIIGTVTLGTDNSNTFKANNKIVNVNTEDIYVPIGSNKATDKSAVLTSWNQAQQATIDAAFEKTTGALAWAENKYYVMNKEGNPRTTIDGGGYPTALNVSNASVKLNPKPVDKTGIILGENGSNVGGMFGYAATEGPVTMQEFISVEVPTITATLPEEDQPTEIGIQTKAGNHVGGLVGNFQNINTGTGTDQIQHRFSGTITAKIGIIAEGAKAGGVIGLQTTENFTHATDHSDAAQVVYAHKTGDVILVDAGEIRAENGHAGGIIGYQEAGKVEIAPANKAVTVKAKNLAGAYAVGGAIGEQNDDARIASGSVYFTATIDDMNITKGIEFFPENTDREMLGSFGTALGIKNHWLEINKANMKTTVDGKSTLTDAKKKDLLFDKHNSAANTETILEGYAFYGDSNGWVGYARETSMYFGPNDVQGNYKMNIYEKY